MWRSSLNWAELPIASAPRYYPLTGDDCFLMPLQDLRKVMHDLNGAQDKSVHQWPGRIRRLKPPGQNHRPQAGADGEEAADGGKCDSGPGRYTVQRKRRGGSAVGAVGIGTRCKVRDAR